MAKVRFRVRTFRDLIASNVLAESEVVELEQALDFLFRVRNGMHLLAESHQDLLTFELQEPLADALGFGRGRRGRRSLHARATTRRRRRRTA